MILNNKSLFVIMILLAFLINCNGGKMPEKTTHSPSIKDIPDSAWKKLSEKRIYFGHQSVGFNIIDGIKDVMKENPQIKLNIVETSDPSEFNTPLFAHSRVGKNRDPKSKLDAFKKFIEEGLGDNINSAFFKFCYVDMGAKIDVKKVFADYNSTMSSLRDKYPNTNFIHFTSPLCTTKVTFNLKIWLKNYIQWGWKYKPFKMIMHIKNCWNYEDDIKRNKFNKLLRKEYDGKEPVFDLAKIESTFLDGKRSSFTKDGKSYYSLVPDYTHDGGHLNEMGRKVVAEQLLILLAGLCE